MRYSYLLSSLAFAAVASAIVMKADNPQYVSFGSTGTDFSYNLENWKPGDKWCDDDNFFISRVRPKQRFKNLKTQVLEDMTDEYDKNLIYWVPSGTIPINALPTGSFDGDVFSMWQYVTHYGNWSAPFMRCPGNFADVAHKNGVGVSTVASTPYGLLGEEWARSLSKLIAVGPEKVSSYMKWYGLDGIGYNSEFELPSEWYEGLPVTFLDDLIELNAKITAMADYKAPLFTNIWYDGTNDFGYISFDQGLDRHNRKTFGDKDNIASSLFLNYNWNRSSLMSKSVNKAREMGRNPFDLYVGVNMQGKEPSTDNESWSMLYSYPLSIGLWGAHNENMMYESRIENGFTPEARQKTYLHRNEIWFTGGTRNPVNCPPISKDWGFSINNTNFFGMSKLMSARSPLCWNLDDEPFITSFNLGNGKFFNWNGEQADKAEWCNIGVQDYLPTWRWWWTTGFMGKDPANVPAKGLEADFIWDDAYMGGSLINVRGSVNHEYLHLFKTAFALKDGDEISLTYKLLSGSVALRLAMSVEGDELTPILSDRIVKTSDLDGQWHTATFIVGKDIPALSGKTLAMVALNFEWAKDLNINLGRLSIRRPSAKTPVPATPVIEKAEVLAFDKSGFDAKVIFNMPNNITGRVCYNEDVNTSLFKVYYQQEGEEPRLKGITTSWAALLYHSAVNSQLADKVRIGVAALSTDYMSESPVAWSKWIDCGPLYTLTPGITNTADDATINEPFEIHFIDPRQPAEFSWSLKNKDGKEIAHADNATGLSLENGLPQPGAYTLDITDASGNVTSYPDYINILQPTTARAPRILSLDFAKGDYADEKDSEMIGDADLVAGQDFHMSYTGRRADGMRSRGLHITGPGYGFKTADAKVDNSHPFSVAFWLCPENLTSNAQIFNLRDKTDVWAKNEWGIVYQTYNPTTKTMQLSLRLSNATESTLTMTYNNVELKNNEWVHMGYSFAFNALRQVELKLTLNGRPLVPDSWSAGNDSGTGDPGQVGRLPEWRKDYVVAIGGNLFKDAGIEGFIDHFQLYDKALSYDELKACYDCDTFYNPDNSLKAAYTFDKDADENFIFKPQSGKDASIPSGIISYVADAKEGQGLARWTKPSYGQGAIQIKSNHEVKTKAEWIVPASELSESTGCDTEGSATGKFMHNGSFQARLRLSNDCGSDQQLVRFITVAQGVHVGSLLDDADNAPDNICFDGDSLLIWLSNGKTYTASISSLDGKTVCPATRLQGSGSPAILDCNAPEGIYILTLRPSDSASPISVKLLKRQ